MGRVLVPLAVTAVLLTGVFWPAAFRVIIIPVGIYVAVMTIAELREGSKAIDRLNSMGKWD